MKKNLKVLLSSSILVIALLVGLCFTAYAEGSKELVSNGGYRPYLEWYNSETAGIKRTNVINVFAKAGETINFGSSVVGSKSDCDIAVTYPNGDRYKFNVDGDSGVGYIDTLKKESVGPYPDKGGYTPIKFNVAQTGIYKFEFHSPNPDESGNPKYIFTNVEFKNINSINCVAAFDVTVKDSNGNAVDGRAFCNYISLNVGLNLNAADVLKSTLYVLTVDGYQYKVDLNGMDPYGFILYANNRGFIDTKSNTSLYKTIVASDNAMTKLLGGVAPILPTGDNTPTNITHRVFINKPAKDLPESIPTNAQAPAQIDDFYFVGNGQNKTVVESGGMFYINLSKDTTYTVYLDFNDDGVIDNNDVVLSNAAAKGLNSIYWDGKDANGNAVQAGEYSVKALAKGGEYHFPLLDVENNYHGVKIELLNPPYKVDGFNEFAIYYDDNNYTTASGINVEVRKNYLDKGGIGNSVKSSMVTPALALDGVDSENGALSFKDLYGNQKGFDFWTYFPGGNDEIKITVEDKKEKFAIISGYVFFDKNKNKVFETSEMPLSDVELEIKDVNGQMQKVVTDGSGHYAATIPVGNYSVSVTNKPSAYVLTTNNDKQTGSVSDGVSYVDNIGYYLGIDVGVDINILNANDKGYFMENDEIQFSITASNNSKLDAANVSVDMPLPAYVEFVSSSSTAYDKDSGLWNIGKLDSKDSVELVLKGKLLKRGTFSYPVTISAEEDINPDNNTSSTSYTVKGICKPETEDYKYKIDVNDSKADTILGEDEENTKITFSIYENCKNGTLNLNSQTGDWDYTPNTDYIGVDTFKVLVTNVYNETAISNTEITIVDNIVVNHPNLSNDYAYIFGRDDIHMMAEDNIYRGEACAVIHRLMKQNDELGSFVYDKHATPKFRDVEGRWDRSAIEYLAFRGAYIANSSESICPDHSISRGEAFKIICLGLGFTDDSTLSVEKYAHILINEGYVKGYEDGTLRLENVITRAEFCQIYNTITGRNKKSLETTEGEEIDAEKYGFVDLKEKQWYYDVMLKATSAYDGNLINVEKRAARNVLDDYQ